MNSVLSAELILGIRLRDLLKLILLLAYAGAILFGVKKHSKKRIRLLRILCGQMTQLELSRTSRSTRRMSRRPISLMHLLQPRIHLPQQQLSLRMTCPLATLRMKTPLLM